jgi:aryl-alcohol dehydrogenase-like predicted oxidoreductase
MTSCSGLFDFAAVDELKRLAARYGKSLPQLTVRGSLNNLVFGTALVGFRRPAEIIESLDALGWGTGNADMAEIDIIFDRHGAIALPLRLAHCATIG